MDELPSVADEASSDDRYKSIKGGEKAAADDENKGADTLDACIDRAGDAAESGDWAGFRAALKEAFSDYGEGE